MCRKCKDPQHDPYADIGDVAPARPDVALRCPMGGSLASHGVSQEFADLRAVDARRRARGLDQPRTQALVRRRRVAALNPTDPKKS